MVSGAAIGTALTILFGRDPGFILGFFLLVGTVAASFAVQPRAVYRIIPVPALAYLGGAIVAGLIHDRAADTSHTALAINAAQWSASGFLVMVTATLLVVLAGAIRFGRQWRRSGGIGPRSPLGPRGLAHPRSQVTPAGRVSARNPSDGPSAGRRHSAGGRSSAASPPNASSSRNSATSGGPARPRSPREGGGGRRSGPPGSGH